MEIRSLKELLSDNSYPGRGIITGVSEDGRFAVSAYFIMGRSTNSRNRVFVESEGGIRTQAHDPSKMEDPSLIIYAPVRVLPDKGLTIVTNGDQTDTIRDGILAGLSFEQSLASRTYEPDGPNYTPRISSILQINEGKYSYALSILKRRNAINPAADRFTYVYEAPMAGEGHFIHTYKTDGDPLPSFEGEPVLVALSGDIDEFTGMIWNSLNDDNKVSLFVRYIDIKTRGELTRIINKHGE